MKHWNFWFERVELPKKVCNKALTAQLFEQRTETGFYNKLAKCKTSRNSFEALFVFKRERKAHKFN